MRPIPFLAVCMLSLNLALTGCSVTYGVRTISPSAIEDAGKQHLMVLSEEFDNRLEKIDSDNTITTYGHPAAVFEMKFDPPRSNESIVHMFDFRREKRIYLLPTFVKQEGPFHLVRIGTLKRVEAYYPKAGQPCAGRRVKGSTFCYTAQYTWENVSNAPKLLVETPGIYLYGTPFSEKASSSSQEFLLKIKEIAEKKKIEMYGF